MRSSPAGTRADSPRASAIGAAAANSHEVKTGLDNQGRRYSLRMDLVLWSLSIERTGAGLATVLRNLQVAFLPLLSFFLRG